MVVRNCVNKDISLYKKHKRIERSKNILKYVSNIRFCHILYNNQEVDIPLKAYFIVNIPLFVLFSFVQDTFTQFTQLEFKIDFVLTFCSAFIQAFSQKNTLYFIIFCCYSILNLFSVETTNLWLLGKILSTIIMTMNPGQRRIHSDSSCLLNKIL